MSTLRPVTCLQSNLGRDAGSQSELRVLRESSCKYVGLNSLQQSKIPDFSTDLNVQQHFIYISQLTVCQALLFFFLNVLGI